MVLYPLTGFEFLKNPNRLRDTVPLEGYTIS